MHSAPTRRATNAQVDLFGQTVAAGVHTREQSGELHSGVSSSIGLTSPQVLFAGGYDAVLPRLAERKWTILGEIGRANPEALGLTEVMAPPALDACWRSLW